MSDRRGEILEVAKEVFAEHGVKHATVREIGARAGILSGSLYHHFASKDDMVDEILRAFCDEVLDRYRTIAKQEADGVARLRVMARYAFSLIPDHTAAMLMLLNDSPELVADARFDYLVAFNTEVERHWTQAVRAGVKQGRIRKDIDPGLFYRFARDAILGAIRWYRPTRGSRSLDRIAEDFNEILLCGILLADAR